MKIIPIFFSNKKNKNNMANKKILTDLHIDGNVGIGTTSPSTKLEVNGDIGIGRVAGGYTFRETVGGSERASIKSNATNELIFSYGASTEAMRINSTGNVGIGTTSPGTKLTVDAGSNIASFRSVGSGQNNKELLIQTGGDRVILDAKNADDGTATALAFESGSSESMRISSDGNVGIGTTSPGSLLHVDGSRTTAIFQANQLGTGVIANFKQGGSSKVLIDNAGNVGIGTTSPDAKLTINGGVNSVWSYSTATTDQPGFVAANNTSFSTQTNLLYSKIYGSDITATAFGVTLGNYAVVATDGSDNNGLLLGTFNAKPLIIGTNNTERMRIDSSGNVGIGTTSPSEKLEVVGSAKLSSTAPALKFEETDRTDENWAFIASGGGLSIRTANSDFSSYDVKMLINQSGNVGIGTTSPASPLHLSMTNGDVRIQGETSRNHILSRTSDDTTWRDLAISATSGQNQLVIATGGNVGIGTDSPGEKLEVSGNVKGSSFITGNSLFGNYGSGDTDITGLVSGSTFGTYIRGNYNGHVVVGIRGNDSGDSFAIVSGGGDYTTDDTYDKLAFKVSAVGNGTFGGTVSATNLSGTNTGDQDLSGYLLKTGGTLTGNLTIDMGGISSHPRLAFDHNNFGTSAYYIEANRSSNLLNFVANGGSRLTLSASAATFSGNVSASNLSGTNTGDQDLSGYALSADYLPLVGGNLTGALSGTSANFTGSLNVGENPSTGEKHVTVGNGRTGNGYSYIDLVGDATYTDYGLRIIRGNSGENTNSSIIHRGTGNLIVQSTDAGNVVLATSGTERMRISSDGNVGIGTITPSEKLNVDGNILATGTIGVEEGQKIILDQDGDSFANIFYDTDGTGNMIYNSVDQHHFKNGDDGQYDIVKAGSFVKDGGTSSQFLKADGSVDSNTYLTSSSTQSKYLRSDQSDTTSGTLTATNFILSSDGRLKENVEEVDNKSINVDWKTFEMKSNKGQKRYGVIAQELEEVHPEFVRTDDEGMKSVAYVDLLIAKNAELEARLEKLERLLLDK